MSVRWPPRMAHWLKSEKDARRLSSYSAFALTALSAHLEALEVSADARRAYRDQVGRWKRSTIEVPRTVRDAVLRRAEALKVSAEVVVLACAERALEAQGVELSEPEGPPQREIRLTVRVDEADYARLVRRVLAEHPTTPSAQLDVRPLLEKLVEATLRELANRKKDEELLS